MTVDMKIVNKQSNKKSTRKQLPAHLRGKESRKNDLITNTSHNRQQKQKPVHSITPVNPLITLTPLIQKKKQDEQDIEPDQKMNTNFLFEMDGGTLVKPKFINSSTKHHILTDFAQEFQSEDEVECEQHSIVKDTTDLPRDLMKDGSESDDSENSCSEENENQDIQEESDPGIISESDVELEIASDTEQDSDNEETNDVVRDRRIQSYFAAEPVEQQAQSIKVSSFTQLKLSRPILKAIASIGYAQPTEIQSRAIPLAMQGKDLCGAAVTGSGKTAAFMIPILERLLHRPKSIPAIRVLVIAPTRELGLQIHQVTKSLATYTDISSCLCVGGLQSKSQEHELRMRPDIVIATPGRLIDHLKNTPGFSLESIDVLVMDEADRMLEDGFREELTEIINSCPRTRQTMLFSATMTENVDDLIRLSLNSPIRLFVDENTAMTKKLVQEFVRVREQSMKIPLLLALTKTYAKETIIFFKSKVAAHETKVMFMSLGLKAAELHGDLNQTDRIASLESFKEKKVDYLLCTDLASRGIDVPNVKAVINYDMPSQYSHYIHRCGRTARAGQKGVACSFIQESDRRIMKIVIKKVSGDVKQRIPCKTTTDTYQNKLPSILENLKLILEEEKESKKIDAEMERITRMENTLQYEDDIKSRPKREWFQSEKEKETSKEMSMKDHKRKMGIPEKVKPEVKRNKFEGLSRRKKRNLECREEDAKSIANQKRSAKSKKASARPEKISKVKK